MKEIHYFIPENAKELKGLVGKSAGVRITSGSPAEPMVFVGPYDKDSNNKKYEFIRQFYLRGDEGEYPTDRILKFIENVENVIFREGVVFHSCRTDICRPSSPGYEERLQLLKNNDLWREIK